MLAKGVMALGLLLPLQSAAAGPVNGTGKTFPGGVTDKDVAQLIHAIMNEQYGASKYSAKYACWDIELDDNDGSSTQYCMKSGQSHVVSEGGTTTLYFLSYNRSDIAGELDYSYSQANLGLMGSFKAIHDDKTHQWIYVAGDKAMEYGAGGACGCTDAKLVTIGTNRHGWIFTSGGDWQGTLVLNYAIVTDFDGKFLNVSAIPRIREGEPDVKYDLHVADSHQTQAMFPLTVTKAKGGKKIEDIDVPFDMSKRIYALPVGK